MYELDSWPWDLDTDFTLGGCLFGGVKLAKNTDPNKYSCSGYGIWFNTCIEYSLPGDSAGKNVIILELVGADQCILIIREKTS